MGGIASLERKPHLKEIFLMEKSVDLGTNRLSPEKEAPQSADDSATSSKPATEKPPLNLSDSELETLRQEIIRTLHTVFDPEIPVNIYELGLIYDVRLQHTGQVDVDMTLTTPACPVAGSLPAEVQMKLLTLTQVTKANVSLVWDPPWDKNRMSEAAKLQLGIDD